MGKKGIFVKKKKLRDRQGPRVRRNLNLRRSSFLQILLYSELGE